MSGCRWRDRSAALSRLAVRGALAAAVCALAATPAASQQAAPAQKVLRVATSGDYAPFSYPSAGSAGTAAAGAASGPSATGGDDPALEGFDIEIARMFARDRGYRLELARFRWPDLRRELAAASFDVAMSGVTQKPERSIAGRFSVAVTATHAVALTWKGSGATDLRELDKPHRRIAVNAGGHLESVAHKTFRHGNVVAIADNDAVRMALLDRAFDAVVTDDLEEKVWAAGAKDVVRIGPLSDDHKAYLLPADRAQIAGELDLWLIAREKDGTLGALRKRFFAGEDASGSAGAAGAEPLAALTTAIVERLELMPMVYAAKKRAGRPIEDPVQEAAVIDAAVAAVAAATAAASSSGTAAAPPDPQAVRLLFETLIAAGKDVQQQLAGADAKRKPAAVLRRDTAPNADAAGNDAGQGTAGAGAAENPAKASTARGTQAPPAASSRSDEPVYDLATELRPAISRIGEKIARIVVAMDQPIPVRTAQAHLAGTLASRGVRSERLEALSAAIVRISTRPASR